MSRTSPGSWDESLPRSPIGDSCHRPERARVPLAPQARRHANASRAQDPSQAAFRGPGRGHGVGSCPAASWSIHALATASASRSLVRVTEMVRPPHDAATTTRGGVAGVRVTTPPGIPPTRAVTSGPGAVVSPGRHKRRAGSRSGGRRSRARIGARSWFGLFAGPRIWKDLRETMSTPRTKAHGPTAARGRLRSPYGADRITPHNAVGSRVRLMETKGPTSAQQPAMHGCRRSCYPSATTVAPAPRTRRDPTSCHWRRRGAESLLLWPSGELGEQLRE